MNFAPRDIIRVATVGLTLALVVTGWAGSTVAAAPSGAAATQTGQYLVRLAGSGVTGGPGTAFGAGPAHVTPAAAAATARTVDRRIDQLQAVHGFRATFRYRYAVYGFAADLTAAEVARLRADPSVASISVDRPVHVAGAPAVPTGIRRVHAAPFPADPAPADLTTVNVAVIDTGIGDGTTATPGLHVQGGVDCADDSDKGELDMHAWRDTLGHGTHVAGIIGAGDVPAPGAPVVGIAPSVALWSVRVFSGVVGSDATVICGLDWVAARNADVDVTKHIDVVNMSLRGGRPTDGADHCPDAVDDEHTAVCAVVTSGATVVVAAGNDQLDTNEVIPAAYDEVITVAALSDFDGLPGGLADETCAAPGAVEHDDTYARYSNFGSAVDLIAPGTCIRSTSRTGGTVVMTGTSMATPHVTGAAARLIAQAVADGHARPTPAEVHDALRATGSFDWDTSTDPDGMPDRLLDVAAVAATEDGIDVAALPSQVTVPHGAADEVVDIELRRFGGFDGQVTLSASIDDASPLEATFDDSSLGGLGGISTFMNVHVPDETPDGDHQVTVTATATGGLSPVSVPVTIHVDRTAPVVTGPELRFRRRATLGQEVPVRITWASTDATGVVVRNVLQRRTGVGAWHGVPLPSETATSSDRQVEAKTDLAYRVRALDDAGNASAWSTLPFRVGVRDSSSSQVTYSQSWSTHQDSSAYGGSLKTSNVPGAFASVTFHGRAVAWVAPAGPHKGIAVVSVDGVQHVIHLDALPKGSRRIVFASGPLTPDVHVMSISIQSGRVDVDAILVLG